MPRRQYQITYSFTLAVDDSEIVTATMDLSGPVIFQGPPEAITEERRLFVDMSLAEMIASGPMNEHVRSIAQRVLDGHLLALSTDIDALLPGSEFHMVETTVQEEH